MFALCECYTCVAVLSSVCSLELATMVFSDYVKQRILYGQRRTTWKSSAACPKKDTKPLKMASTSSSGDMKKQRLCPAIQ